MSDNERLERRLEQFLEPGFDSAAYISQCRATTALPQLRAELDTFLATIRSSVVELINKDYADFVSLSSNLVRHIPYTLEVFFFSM